MIRYIRCAGLALVAAQLSACGAPPAGSTASDPHAVQVASPGEATCIATSRADNMTGAAATNAARRQAGLQPIQPSMALAQVAAGHACDMAQRGRMTHIGTSSSGPGDRLRAAGYRPSISAENIAAGPFSLNRVLTEWQTSSGHRTNILLPQVRDYGIGHAVGPDGRTRYWAAVYAAPR
jgi:uncharacterized protein YkwD